MRNVAKKKVSQTAPPQQNHSHPSHDHASSLGQDHALSFALAGAGLLIAASLIYLTIRKRWLQQGFNNLGETTKAILTAWGIWIIVVSSYVLLFSPYESNIDNEEMFNLILWFTLPPLSVLAIHRWLKRFVSAKK